MLIVLLCDSGKDSKKDIAEYKLVVLVLAVWMLDIVRDNVKNRAEEVEKVDAIEVLLIEDALPGEQKPEQ